MEGGGSFVGFLDEGGLARAGNGKFDIDSLVISRMGRGMN